MKRFFAALLSAALLAAACLPAYAAETAQLNISADGISHEVSENLYGVFIEDI